MKGNYNLAKERFLLKFDVSKYEQPNRKAVNMRETKKQVGVFLNTYFSARTRIGETREPKITTNGSLIPP